MFAPALTLLDYARHTNCVVAGASVKYENNASVSTSFVTNLGDYRVDVDGTLRNKIDYVSDQLKAKKALPKYDIPYNVVTSARLQKIATKGLNFTISDSQCPFTRAMDEQKNIKRNFMVLDYT